MRTRDTNAISVTSFLYNVYAYDKGEEDDALDYLMSVIEDELWAGDEAKQWPWIEEVLETLDLAQVDDSVICGFMAMCLPIRNRVKGWKAFTDRCRAHMALSHDAEETNAIMLGFER